MCWPRSKVYTTKVGLSEKKNGDTRGAKTRETRGGGSTPEIPKTTKRAYGSDLQGLRAGNVLRFEKREQSRSGRGPPTEEARR